MRCIPLLAIAIAIAGVALASPARSFESSPVVDSGPDGAWTAFSPPRTRAGHVTIHDPTRDRIVVFGGTDLESGDHDVWAFSLVGRPSWTLLNSEGSRPPARARWQGVLDPARDRVILFGGIRDYQSLQDLWSFSLSGSPRWTQFTPFGTPPVPRSGATMVYDSVRDRVILFGGITQGNFGATLLNDVWELRLTNPPVWNRLTTGGTSPSARTGHCGIYNDSSDRLLVYGGWTGSAKTSETWALSFSGSPVWTLLAPSGPAPPVRDEASAIIDVASNGMVLHGGTGSSDQMGDTWRLDLGLAPSWTQLVTSNPPTARHLHGAVYDGARQRMVMVGGSGFNDPVEDVQALSLVPSPTWTALWPLDSLPLPRARNYAIYDPVRERMVIWGGEHHAGLTFTPLNDTWALDLAGSPQWRRLGPADSGPRPLLNASAMYDPERDRVLMFGGRDASGASNDLWSLSLATSEWSMLTDLGTTPSPRAGHAAVYDPVRHRMIVFGGASDVWTWSLPGSGPWASMPTTGTGPTSLFPIVGMYDPIRDRIVAYVGTNPATALWALSLTGTPTWTQVPTTGSPPTRGYNVVGVYDPPADRFVVSSDDRTWALDLASHDWTELYPQGTPPPGHYSDAAGIYDPARRRLLMMGGMGAGSVNRGEVRVLEWMAPVAVDPLPVTQTRVSLPFPNPTRAGVVFDVTLPRDGRVSASVWDVNGRLVRRLVDGEWRRAGDTRGIWNGRDEVGRRVHPGLYLIRFSSNSFAETRRIVVLE